MSPILVRPVREQLEHDRVIRLLQAKYKRKFEVGINPGPSQASPVGTGDQAMYPDLVLQSTDKAHKLLGVVEVETVESVNRLEAMHQWVRLGRLRAELHLYVPASSIDTTRRLCAEFQVPVAEIWAYHTVGEEVRFTLIQKSAVSLPPEPKAPAAPKAKPAPKAKAVPAKPASKRSAPAKPAPVKAAAKKAPAKVVETKAKAAKKAAPAKAKAPKPAAKKAPVKKAPVKQAPAKAKKPAARKR